MVAAIEAWQRQDSGPGRVAMAGDGTDRVRTRVRCNCIDGQADAANKRITDTPGIQQTRPESQPGDERDDDSNQTSLNARLEARSRADGQRNRSHRLRPWPFPAPV
jgi:hypothetical protein